MSNRKKINYGATDFDNDTDNLPDLPGGNTMAMFENYTQFNVTQKKAELMIESKALIKSLIDLYLSTDKMQRPEYVDAIQKVENMTLASLLGQVKYAEHALDSLMRQLDGGGFTDPATYEMIMRMQSSSIDITLRVAQYVRSLPDYFKHLESDITKYQSIPLIKTGESTLTNEDGVDVPVDEFTTKKTYRGTGDLIKMVEAARKAGSEKRLSVAERLKNQNNAVSPLCSIDDENVEDVDSSSVNDNEDDD